MSNFHVMAYGPTIQFFGRNMKYVGKNVEKTILFMKAFDNLCPKQKSKEKKRQ